MKTELRASNRKALVNRILTWCAGAAVALALILTGNRVLALVFVVIAMIFGGRTSRATENSGEIRKQLGKMMTTERLEARFRAMYLAGRIARILTWCGVAAIILTLAIRKDLLIALGYLFIAVVIGKVAGWVSNRSTQYKTILAESAAGDVVRSVLGEGAQYHPAGALNPGGVVVPFHYERTFGEHHIKTSYKGVNLELGSVKLLDESESLHEQTAERVVTVLVRFLGPWLICDFQDKPACNVYVSQRTKRDSNVLKSNVNLGSDSFGSRFCVQAEDPQEAYKILTPRMKQAISAAADMSGGTVYLSFLTDGKMNVGIQNGHGLFEVGNHFEGAEELRRRFSEELRRLTAMVDTLIVSQFPQE